MKQRRFIAVVLVLTLVLGLPPAAAHAAVGTGWDDD